MTKNELETLQRRAISAATRAADARYAYRTVDDNGESAAAYDAALSKFFDAEEDFQAAIKGSGFTDWHGSIVPE